MIQRKIRIALQDYFSHYFIFSGYATRENYWWAMGTIYILTIIFGILSSFVRFPWLMVIWLLMNIFPLITLQFRRLRDVGFNNVGLITLSILYLASLGIFLMTNSSFFAFVLQIIVLAFVLLPILKKDELAIQRVNSPFAPFMRTKTSS